MSLCLRVGLLGDDDLIPKSPIDADTTKYQVPLYHMHGKKSQVKRQVRQITSNKPIKGPVG